VVRSAAVVDDELWFELCYIDEAGSERREPPALWAGLRPEGFHPVREFRWARGQGHLPGLWWSATAGAWDHARKLMPAATEAGLAGAVEDLLTRAGQGPGGVPAAAPAKRERRVAARTRAVGPSVPSGPDLEEEPAAGEHEGEAGSGEAVIPMPVFDAFREAEKWR
jgi:hypothetical protein